MRTPESRDSSESSIPTAALTEAQQRAIERRQALDLQQRMIRNMQPGQNLHRNRPPG